MAENFQHISEIVVNSFKSISSVFEKRAGSTDRGKEYEHLYITNLVLKLVTDDTVEDFFLASNDNKFGAFDDVVVTIRYCSKKENETYAIQLKQSKNKVLRSRDLTATKGQFSIKQYLEDYYKTIQPAQNRIKLILLTTCKEQIDETITTEVNGEEIGIKISTALEEDLLSTYRDGRCCYVLKSEPKYDDFFRNFFLYTGQAGVFNIKKLTSKLFTDVFHCNPDIFKDFVNFITTWSLKEGSKEKLSKIWMKQAIALCILSPFIKPLSFVKTRRIDKKGKLFSTAVSKFHVTTLGRDNFGKIKNLWPVDSSGLDLEIANKVRLKYEIGLKFIQNFEDLSDDDKDTNKLWWLLGKSPLVVEGSQEIYEAINLCKNLIFVVLSTDIRISKKFHCFQNLSQLKTHEHLYEEVLTNLTYSLECQKEAPLNALLQIDENFDVLVTTDMLVQMLLGPLDIGRQEEVLPACHVSRTVCKISIDPKFLKQPDNSFIVITGVEDFETFRLLFGDLQVVDSESGLEINFPTKTQSTNLIFLSRRDYNQEEFDQLCRKRTRRNQCHQFRYINSECLEWIRSHNVQEVKQFRLDHEYLQETLNEADLFGDGENHINIICANSGMGKTTLMKSLKYSSSSSIWTLLICARNHSLHYRQQLQVDTFLEYIWAYNCKHYNAKEKIIFQTLMNRGKVRLIWDGLDEVTKESFDNILILVKQISKRGIKQWITTRNNLKNNLEEKLQTLAKRIKEFDAEEQRTYIKNRLHSSSDDLFELFKKIKTNIQPFSNSDFLGIPLQVYMLTELFLRDKDKYMELLNQSFTILDLYQNFVWEKFKLYYVDKIKLDLGIGKNYQKCIEEMTQRIECYKRVAYGVHFTKGILDYFHKTSDNFLEEIKQFGDHVGFVSNVTDDIPEFVHNSFGDYFTALYLHDNDPNKAKDHNFVNNDVYNNIRFFLDLLLSQNRKAHLAVLFKNSSLLDECSEQDLTQVDRIGRTVLELSCSWSYQYEIARIQRIGFGRFNIHTKYLNNDVKKLQYRHDFSRIQVVDIRIKKILILMPFLIPQYIKHVDDECAALLLYYSVVFDHIIILKYMDNILWLKKVYERFDPKYLLSVALLYESPKVLQELIRKEEYRQSLRGNLDILLYTCRFGINGIFSLFSKHVIDINEFIFFACRQGRVENVRFLIDKGARTDIPDGDGRFPMHHACDNEIDGFRIVEFLIMKNEDTNVVDLKRRLPLHYVCMNTMFATKILKILKTQYLDILDIHQRAPLHYACDNEDFGYAIAEFLVMKKVKLNQQDISGRTPMHYACMNWKFGFEIIKLLLDNFADCNILDCKNRTPLHYVCKNYHRGFDIAKLMIAGGVDTNLVDSDGRMPIHYACESGKFETVKLLIDKIDRNKLLSSQNPTLLHDTCKNYSHGYEICRLLLHRSFSVNSIDKYARSPLHVACEFGRPETVKLLLSKGAATNIQDVKKRLPFHYACMNIYHSSQIVQMLINFQSRIGALDCYNRLPIHYACKKGNVYSVFLLIEKNHAQISFPDSYGRLPIHYACCNFNNGSEIVKLLLKEGASLNVTDRDGRMPIHYACETGNIYLVRLLSEVGTVLDVKDVNNRTPLDCAHDAENYNIVQLLTTVKNHK